MKKVFLSLLILFAGLSLQGQQSLNMSLLANWDDNTLPQTFTNRYNECWGYTACDGSEYAILGSAGFVHFFDLQDPSDPQEVDSFEGGNITTWRDMKTFQDRAYSVCDACSEGLMIFDLSSLPGEVALTNQTTEFFGRSHNIFIDTESGWLYAVGTDSLSNGMIVLDLNADPDEPTLLARADLPGGYIHDVYVRDNIAYCSHGNNGLYIYDFSNPADPVLLGTLTDYPEQGYNHSSWLSEDGVHLVFADESFNRGLKTADVTDFSDIQIEDVFRSALLGPSDTASIAHNPIIRGDYVFISYYHDGVQVFDLSDPTSVQKAAYYDTEPDNLNYQGFTGCWGVYPFLPSGTILASDMHRGLFILQTEGLVLSEVEVPLFPPDDITPSGAVDLCEGESLEINVAEGADQYQWYLDGQPLAVEGNSLTATESGQYTVELNNDYCKSSTGVVDLTINPLPQLEITASATQVCEGDIINLSVPEGADAYQWHQFDFSIPGANEAGLMVTEGGMYSVSATLGDCSGISEEIMLDFLPLPEAFITIDGDQLLSSPGESYQWYLNGEMIIGAVESSYLPMETGAYQVLVIATNGCSAISDILVFMVDNVRELPEGWDLSLFPNPAGQETFLTLDLPAGEEVRLQLSDIRGRMLEEAILPAGTRSHKFDLRAMPSGVYVLRVGSKNGQHSIPLVVVQD